MKPNLLDKYYKITYFLKFLGQNILKCGLYAQKNPKMYKNGHISFRTLSLSHTTKNATPPSFFNFLAETFQMCSLVS